MAGEGVGHYLDGVRRFSAMNGVYQTVSQEDPETLLLNVEVWGARLVGR